MTRTVRTTMNPSVEIEVSDSDYTDLSRWGLLAEGAPKAENPASTDNPSEAPAKGTDKKE